MLHESRTVGFFGKLPSHGDFLRRRVSDAFVSVWDGWLQEGLAASRAALGDRWLDVYLTSPAWRFAAEAGLCGEAGLAGVMLPSVDRVGRYFPITIVAELPAHVTAIAAVMQGEAFFENAERLVIDTLEAEDVDFERFDEEVAALAALLDPLCAPTGLTLDAGAAALLASPVSTCIHMPVGTTTQLAPAFAQLLSLRLSTLYAPFVIWWSAGSGVVEPACVLTQDLPRGDAFTALLDGSWGSDAWWTVPARIDAAASDTVVPGVNGVAYRSAAVSDVGRVRTVNQDSYLERSDVGMWVVADGLGGHADGEVASRMVCDAFADLVPESTFENLIESACERLQQVNDQLIRASERSPLGIRSGSTVVAMLARGAHLALIWAGDSRGYRLRDGQFEQLTRDHSLAADALAGGDPAEANVVTRAVGGEPTLLLDVHRDRVRPGDRYLLCSDGLTRTLPDGRIQEILAAGDIAVAAQALVTSTLEAGATDNVTVLIVEAGT